MKLPLPLRSPILLGFLGGIPCCVPYVQAQDDNSFASGQILVIYFGYVDIFPPSDESGLLLDLNSPAAEIAAFTQEGNAFVGAVLDDDAGPVQDEMLQVTPNGQVDDLFKFAKGSPNGMDIDSQGDFFVSKSGESSVAELGPTGKPLRNLQLSEIPQKFQLSSDEKALYYTSNINETSDTFSIKRFDLATSKTTGFAPSVPGTPGEFRTLADGGLLIATQEGFVLRLDSFGSTVRRYYISNGYSGLMSLTPDGKSFWLVGSDQLF